MVKKIKKSVKTSVKKEAKKDLKKEIKSEPRKTTSVSKVLGILSICMGILIPIFGIVLGIIGLSVNDPEKRRYKFLNIIGIILSLALWIFSFWILTKTGGSLV